MHVPEPAGPIVAVDVDKADTETGPPLGALLPDLDADTVLVPVPSTAPGERVGEMEGKPEGWTPLGARLRDLDREPGSGAGTLAEAKGQANKRIHAPLLVFMHQKTE